MLCPVMFVMDGESLQKEVSSNATWNHKVKPEFNYSKLENFFASFSLGEHSLGNALFSIYEEKYGPDIYKDMLKGSICFS